LERRRLFIALAEALRVKSSPLEEDIVSAAARFSMSRGQVITLLQESTRRDVLVQTGATYQPRIPLFGRWLSEHGPAKIGAQLGGSYIADALRLREEELRVTSLEIKSVTERWGTYRGIAVTAEDVRAWLDQFVGPESQRLMFRIIEGLTFYTGARISEIFSEVHRAIARGTREKAGTLLRSDVVISYLDGAGKSGAEMVKKYRMATNISYDNVLEISELPGALDELVPAIVVFVDDFVATGASVEEGLRRLDPSVVAYLRREGVRTGFACVAGFDAGLKRVGRAFRDVGVKARVNAGDVLTDADRCFHAESRFFGTEHDRFMAESIAQREGERLEKRQPLGYGGCQAVVVFEGRCPNNTLPILWSDRAGWKPLFRRN
jgi:hypothetical protein